MRTIAITTTFPRQRLAAADAVVERLTDLRVRVDGDHMHMDFAHSPLALP
jgi:hypothetical protein